MLSRRSLLTAGLVLAAGCKTTTTFVAPAGEGSTPVLPDGVDVLPLTQVTSIAMVGDSITEASEPAFRDAFAAVGVDDVIIDGEASRRIEIASNRNGPGVSGVKAVEAILEGGAEPTVWVIALGTNDVGSFGTPQDCAELIQEITTLLPSTVPLVWVNVYRPSDLRQTRVFNEVLESVLDARGTAVIADWFTLASNPDEDILRSDDLHPNDDGEVAFASVVIQALQRL